MTACCPIGLNQNDRKADLDVIKHGLCHPLLIAENHFPQQRVVHLDRE
jgi:hypothetical protein